MSFSDCEGERERVAEWSQERVIEEWNKPSSQWKNGTQVLEVVHPTAKGYYNTMQCIASTTLTSNKRSQLQVKGRGNYLVLRQPLGWSLPFFFFFLPFYSPLSSTLNEMVVDGCCILYHHHHRRHCLLGRQQCTAHSTEYCFCCCCCCLWECSAL